MPGKRDYISVARNTHMQKRLLLCDLKELYAAFKQNYPHLKIGFSKFCSLRPKWYVLVGCSGTHSVCVCTIHQNVILMLDAVNLDKDYYELMDMMVCSRVSKECMIHHCKNCIADTQAMENYRVYKKNGVHVLCLIISKLLKLIAQFWTCFKPRSFLFRTSRNSYFYSE